MNASWIILDWVSKSVLAKTWLAVLGIGGKSGTIQTVKCIKINIGKNHRIMQIKPMHLYFINIFWLSLSIASAADAVKLSVEDAEPNNSLSSAF